MSGTRDGQPPSAYRLARARLHGVVACSSRLTGAAGFIAVVVALAWTGHQLWATLESIMRTGLGTWARSPREPAGLSDAAWSMAALGIRSWSPVALAGFGAALLVGGMQTRGLVTSRPIAPDMRRLAPGERLSAIVSGNTLFDLIAIIGILAVAAGLLWGVYSHAAGDVARMAAVSAETAGGIAGHLAGRLLAQLAVALAVIGVLDYLWRRRAHRRALATSPREAQLEHRALHGDPARTAERRRRQTELVRMSSPAAITRADLVLAGNGIVVGLRYDPSATGAPRAVAVGAGIVAQRMLEIARAAAMPVQSSHQLAARLATLPLGAEIPEPLYQAVAQLLAASMDGAGEPRSR